MANKFKLRNTVKYPTSMLINGLTNLGLELVDSLLDQGGYVILVDNYNYENVSKLVERFGETALISLVDYAAIPHLEEDVRRLDYIFYFAHDSLIAVDTETISTQTFLRYSNYLDALLALATRFEAKFLLTTSVRAHQQLLASKEIDINFGKDVKAKHTVYTDVEVQRYAESLALEYVNKVNLNARIVRIAQIIGQGMDFSQDATFTKLLLSAVSEQELILKDDGLDTEWYVHLLDAAYGLIKAQFTKDTVGNIYSLSYDIPLTDLSVAYKLQELEPGAKEIKFVETQVGTPPLKLHKPAPNLSTIGWRPKIDFEQAVKESLAAAKLFVVNFVPVGNEVSSDGKVVSKLKAFLSIAKEKPKTPFDHQDDGPIARLIAERKTQEQSRQVAIEKAEHSIKMKQKVRKLSRVERLRNWIWSNFLSPRTNMGFLKSVTPAQFVFYSLVFLLFIYLYFALFSPLVVLGRNIMLANNYIGNLHNAVAQYDFNGIYTNAMGIKKAMYEVSDIVDSFLPVLHIVAADSYAQKLSSLAQNNGLLAEGMEEIAYANIPLQEYFERYIDNIKFRPNSESYLSVAPGTDYSNILDELIEREVFAEVGLQKLHQATNNEISSELAFLPESIVNTINGFQNALLSSSSMDDLVGLASNASELLGLYNNITYLVLVTDTARPMPIGGALSSYFLFTVQNGSITEARLQSIDSFTPDMITIPSYVKNEINSRVYGVKDTFELSDIAYIGDTNIFNNVAKDLWGDLSGRKIDIVTVVSLQTLGDMIDEANGINVEGIDVSTGNNLLSVLESLQTSNASISRRNDLIAQTFALTVDKLLDNYREDGVAVVKLLSNEAISKGLILSQSDLKFNSVVQKGSLYGSTINNTDMPVEFSLISDPQVISPTRYPAYNLATKITVNLDSSLHYEMTAKFPSVGNVSAAALCLSLSAKNIQVQGVPTTRIDKQTVNNRQCLVANVLAETEILYSWDTIQFENIGDSEYNLTLGQFKLPGAEVISDVEINLSPGLSFSSIYPEVTINGGRVIFTQTLVNDQIIELVISK